MLKPEWLLTCAPIGILDSKHSWKGVASGVFVYDHPFIWYVTSYQPICNGSSKSSCHVLLRHKKMGQILFDISSIHKQEKIDWIFDEQNNIAATLFPADPDYELKAVGFENFLVVHDMLPAMHCYSVGYPYMLAEDTKKISPGVLEGVISRIDGPSKVYVTTPIFPDNYGCPLFVLKSPVDSNGAVNLGGPSLYLGGIMTKTLSIDAGKEGNSFGVMSSSELIKNLLFCSEALAQKKRVKEKNGV